MQELRILIALTGLSQVEVSQAVGIPEWRLSKALHGRARLTESEFNRLMMLAAQKVNDGSVQRVLHRICMKTNTERVEFGKEEIL